MSIVVLCIVVVCRRELQELVRNVEDHRRLDNLPAVLMRVLSEPVDVIHQMVGMNIFVDANPLRPEA